MRSWSLRASRNDRKPFAFVLDSLDLEISRRLNVISSSGHQTIVVHAFIKGMTVFTDFSLPGKGRLWLLITCKIPSSLGIPLHFP